MDRLNGAASKVKRPLSHRIGQIQRCNCALVSSRVNSTLKQFTPLPSAWVAERFEHAAHFTNALKGLTEQGPDRHRPSTCRVDT